ncbi:antibiotic biosynthesis monooxygenase family protein [Candidatus Endowatersipora endosymbiont of Watersipora subatra]|uniref:antibiotic biosynthesis monooxygenase family protein n=1 Tax=Candidatus Endowatersipora endosymbiont of Watersipora subatra TaxID=3077946 RepID=UPI00312CA3CB
MKRWGLISAVLFFWTSNFASALAWDKELENLNLTIFHSVDANEDGLVSNREVEHFRNLVMLSMDSNDDEEITLSEFMSWDVGWKGIAKERNKEAQYRTSLIQLFKSWDLNGDTSLSLQEQKLSQSYISSNEPMDFKNFSTHVQIMAVMNKAIAKKSNSAILVTFFSVPAGKEEESIKYWENTAKFLRSQPGYISSELHQALSSNAKFPLVNISKWDTIDSFDKATIAMNKSSTIKSVDGLNTHASLYKIIR